MTKANLPATASTKDSRLRKIRQGIIIFQVISVLLGIGMIVLAFAVGSLESQILRELHLGITKRLRVAFYVLGSFIILNSILGFLAQFTKKKAYLWMIYCTVLGCLVLITLTASGSALTLDLGVVQRNMLSLFQNYEDESKRRVVKRRTVDLVDRLQETYKCCGVNSFKDWQDVEFGRTSLKVPRSCCKLRNVKGQVITSSVLKSSDLSSEDLERYNECGLLCLPAHINSEKFLYTDGCFLRIFGSLKLVINLMGFFGLTVGLLFAIGFLITTYLIGSKGI